MTASLPKFSPEQLAAASRAADVLRVVARGIPDLDLMMAMADHDVRDLPGYGTTLDALVVHHFPEWAGGTATQAGMGRRQWSAIVIPDPRSATKLAFPRFGVLQPNGRVTVAD